MEHTFRCSALLDEDDDEAARLIAEESLLLASPRGQGKSVIRCGLVTPNNIQQGCPQPVVLAGNGTVNVGSDEARWQPLPGIENEDSDQRIRVPG